MSRASRILLELPRPVKAAMAVAADALLAVATVWLAFCLRLDVWASWSEPMIAAVAAALIIVIPTFYLFGLYRAVHRFAGWNSLLSIAAATAIYGVLYSSLFAIMGIPGVPRSIGIMQPILLFIGAGFCRAVIGLWLGGIYQARFRKARAAVLIYGAGAAGGQLASALDHSLELRPIGFIDDNPALQGGRIRGLKVFKRSDLHRLLNRYDVAEILLAIPSASQGQRNEILQSLVSHGVRVRTLPGYADIAHGRVRIDDVRPLEIEDLLGRDAVPPNTLLASRNINEKTVVVTGAGGSIGGELCRQVIDGDPACILLIESSEYALYSIHQEITSRLRMEKRGGIVCIPLLASVRDSRRIEEIFSTWRPDTVYHAAAFKHVPIVEHNPIEGVLNNVFGTLVVAEAAQKYNAERFVLISTDKAVRPTNVMGTTKRLAEMVLQAKADQGSATCFSMVRFGNVLGSSGSVVPLFRRQIAEGGPLTITHQDITRYFMTIPEAAQLVIQAGAMAQGGEVFVLDMGDPVRIADLARKMIELSGLSVKDTDNAAGDIEIKVVGLRPGEKLYEELLIGDDPEATPHPRIMKARERFVAWPELAKQLAELAELAESGDAQGMVKLLKHLVPEYSHPERSVVDWVQLHKLAS